ncbi:MAG: hypothetical protein QOE17_1554 [Gaiellales bacterium]|jgi:hypothetical protein|nr:hypothetical protein [Gaiellales bacterium]
MASESVITVRGRRLVAGRVEDPARPRVLATREVFVTAGAVSATVLGLSLGAVPLLVHGWAVLLPLLAAFAGAALGFRSHRARLRAAQGKQHPPLPRLAIVEGSRRPVVGGIARMVLNLAIFQVVVVAAGHGSPPSKLVAACLIPALFGNLFGSIVPGTSTLIRFEKARGERVYQPAGSFMGGTRGMIYIGTDQDG